MEPQNAGKQQIFQEKQQLIKDLEALRASQLKLQAQIAEKEDQLKELTGPLLETELPDEILLKIFGYMSTYDVLRNVARVSTKFKKLSVDPFLIRKIEIHDEGQWTNAQIRGCMKVLKKSQNLKSFSFDLNWNFDAPVYKRFLKALSTFNHPNLEEFCIKGKNSDSSNNGDVWFKEVSLIKKLMKYLKKCPNLKILKFLECRTVKYMWVMNVFSCEKR